MQNFINIDDFILEIRLIHNQLNALLFKNYLKPVKFVVEDNRRIKKKHTLGSFMPNSGYLDQDNSMQIVIYTLCLNGDYYSIIATLIHEMVHQYNFQKGIKDTENNGRHNKNFRDTALSVGLYIEPTVRGDKTNSHGLGFAFTKLSDYLKHIIDNKLDFNKEVLKLKHHAALNIKEDKRIAYRCEGCDFRVTTKQNVRLKCLDCNLELLKTIKS
ncbi:SprT-like domain-containing protein [Spiroplasma culicicola]|uniref:SprT-like domain-containing protein n=1 Tax=Spiroplasma culicicola AES-1 TaxID=1276246 RepID=W6A7F5_9MOLU|nr:SprT-like domain-containing protein [Spiroplasma culicicola]AHI52916.1 hypothetical protein SCULI_v1c05750 [Spiroplasma culicicola AES-1]